MKRSLLFRFVIIAGCCLATAVSAEAASADNDRHVVVLVWDGMRPDFVTERHAPTLWKLAQQGVVFRHHHSIYPTATNVNGTAMATGVYPSRNTLLANREFRPAIDPRRPFENADEHIIAKADQVTGGKYIAAPTIAEIVRDAGRPTAVAGTKSVVLLHDRHAEFTNATSKNSLTRFAAAPMPAALRDETVKLLGPLPVDPARTTDERNNYATRALTEVMWREGLPAFSLLWLSDPDMTEHEFAPGSAQSLAAVESSDRNLSLVLEAIAKHKARQNTDVFVVSDHGFSTIARSIDFPAELRKAGFDGTAAFTETPKPGQVMVVGNAGSILFYVIDHQREVVARLLEWLQHSDFAGVIFAREKFEGTFPLEAIHANTPDAPDLLVALRWDSKPNQFGVPGHIVTDAARGPGKGSHVSLSEFDVHNTLIAAGPDFRSGLASDLPSANIDLAPTILQILGITPPGKFDGRVLTEAMVMRSPKSDALNKTIEATRKFPNGEWRQHLKVSLVGETLYLDEGNGAFEPAAK